MPDLAQQLRAVIDDAALPVTLDEVVNRRSRPTTKGRVLTAAAVVAAVIAVAGIVVTRSADHRRATVDVTNPATVTGWLQLPKGPIPPRAGHVMVWTGSRLLVWGGVDSGGPLNSGFAYDPATARWEALPDSPLQPTSAFNIGVWDGTELLIWENDPGTTNRGGAAYNPTTDRWRSIASSPVPLNQNAPVVAWTGREVLLWSPSRTTGTTDPVATTMATYDPATDQWQTVHAGPLDVNQALGVWDGTELLIVGWLENHITGVFPAGGQHPAAAFNPVTGQWRELPPAPWQAAQVGTALSLAWDGHQAIAYTYDLHSAAYDPVSNRWEPLADLPLTARECYPTSAAIPPLVFAYYCGDAAVYDSATRTWKPVPTPFPPQAASTPLIMFPPNTPLVATDRQFVILGNGAREQNTSGWAYTPTDR